METTNKDTIIELVNFSLENGALDNCTGAELKKIHDACLELEVNFFYYIEQECYKELTGE